MTYNVSSNSNTPVIALDLDGVCSKTRYGFIEEIGDLHDLEIPKERLYNRRLEIPQVPESYSEATSKIIKSDPSVYSRMSKIKGSALATRTLNSSYKIKIVSSRFSDGWLDKETREQVFKATKKWLSDNNFVYDEIVNPIKGKKSSVSADIFIDDTPEVIREIDGSNTFKIIYIRPHNMQHIPYNCWNATKYDDKRVEDLVQNPQKQWTIITNYLRDFKKQI